MPATPLPDRHVEELEEVEDAWRQMMAGQIRFLEALSAAKGSGLLLAMGARKLRQLAITYDETTPTARRTAREIEEDKRRLKNRKWTKEGLYYLESLVGGKDEPA